MILARRFRCISFTFFLSTLVFSGAAVAQDFLKGFPAEAYFKLESGSRTVGKNSFSWRREGERLHFQEDSEMKVTLFGREQLISTKLGAETNLMLELQSFDYRMQTSDSEVKITGQRVGPNLRIEKHQAGNIQRSEILIQEPLLVNPLVRPHLLRLGLPAAAEPKTFSAMLMEPSAFNTIPMQMKVEKKGDLYDLEVSYMSHKMQSQINQHGSLLRERAELAGMELVVVPVKKEEFEKIQTQTTKVDLVDQARVRFPQIQNSRALRELSVEISGIDLHRFQLTRHRQRLSGNVLTVKVESTPPQSAPVQSLVGRKSLDPYLQAEMSIPVQHPTIQAKARQIVGDENDLWQRALKVHQFVFKELEKDPYISLPDALEALQTKKGDCNEHAALYVALARAAGIPARMVVGLVYSDRFYGAGQSGFYYHAWVEVFTGVEWVSIDPTWNQVPSDATHLVFVEGGPDQQVQIAALMGNIRLKRAEAPAPLIQ